MNIISLTGRLSNEPDFRTNQNGTSICRFTVASSRQTKDGGADFIPCVAFNKTAEFVKKYFVKGQKIDLTGRLTSGSYKSKDGDTVFTLNVNVSAVEFGESKASKDVHIPKEDKAEEGPGAAPSESFMDIPNVPEGVDELVPF